MRPSTSSRIGKLQRLLDALASGDLALAEAMALLACSSTCARNYLRELQNAGLIHALHSQARSLARPRFRLAVEHATVAAFLAELARAERAAAIVATPRQLVLDAGAAPLLVRRDPLVAALFGSARA